MLGRIPEIAAASSGGLVLVAAGMSALRIGALPEWLGTLLFWLGLLLVVLPAFARLVGVTVARWERIALLLLIAEGTYLVKVLREPVMFTFHDELSHIRTLSDVVASGRLYEPNSLLVVSPVFPGLESVTSSVIHLGDVPLFVAGVLVVALARALLAVGLFLIYERASDSTSVAALGVAFYMLNPSFLFFTSTFVYESLGLALTAVLLYVTLRRRSAAGAELWRLNAIVVALVVAVVLTHHVTTIATVAVLGLLAGASWFVDRDRVGARRMAEVAVLMAVLFAVWLVVAARPTIAYLGDPLIDLGRQVIVLLEGGLSVLRPLFTAENGVVAPFWERIVALGATLVTLTGVLISAVLFWRHRRDVSSLPAALAVASLAYPVSLLMRATQAGGELAARSSSYLFAAVGFALAVTVAWLLSLEGIGVSALQRRVGVIVAGGVLLVGGVTIGSSTWHRLPGPYLVEADSRSMNLESSELARWAAADLGPDHRFATDRFNRLMLASYGHQTAVFSHGGGTAVWAVFMTDSVSAYELDVLRRGEVDYVVIDRRLADGPPYVGYYYEKSELTRRRADQPMTPDQLDNFDHVPGASRVYDSGSLQAYDVRQLTQ